MPSIHLSGVTVERGGTQLLREVSLALPADFVGSLIGPSGAGKTTALRLMNRLIEPTAGEVRVDGRPISEHPIGALRRRVAMVFNETHLLGLTVEENIRLLDPHANGGRVEEVLRQAGLDESFLPRREQGLSAGEKHRVALARALMGEPEMLLLDEVTSSLDRGTALEIIRTLQALRRERGLAIVLASHALEHVRTLGGECVVMVNGEIVERGESEIVLIAPREEATRAFLAGERMEGRRG
ncbi:ATP-binding cassette domain-containing protein [Candidatus Sumerlaeota bacterium]|nr:ATP-binding cassette domain-containing protein [Candidatus Sumerlaeota bacterium]